MQMPQRDGDTGSGGDQAGPQHLRHKMPTVHAVNEISRPQSAQAGEEDKSEEGGRNKQRRGISWG